MKNRTHQRLLTIVLGLLGCTGGVLGQPPNSGPDEGLAAMQAISFLTGEWEGSGWMQRGPGEPHRVDSREMVESRLDGRVLLVEGLHYAEGTQEVVHHAMAVLSYDPETKGYRFRSHLNNGRAGDYSAKLDGGNFVWMMEVPGRSIRYTIKIEGNQWNEVGESSTDGETWIQFFQMDLTRSQN